MRKYEGGNPDLSTNLFKPSFAVGLLFQLAIHVPVLVLGPGQLSLHVLEALLVVLMVLRNLCGGCLTFFHFFHFALCNFQLAFVVRLQFLALWRINGFFGTCLWDITRNVVLLHSSTTSTHLLRSEICLKCSFVRPFFISIRLHNLARKQKKKEGKKMFSSLIHEKS